jgi:hypothetical protein
MQSVTSQVHMHDMVLRQELRDLRRVHFHVALKVQDDVWKFKIPSASMCPPSVGSTFLLGNAAATCRGCYVGQ